VSTPMPNVHNQLLILIHRNPNSYLMICVHQQKRFLVIAASQGLLYLIVYVTPVSISDSLSSNL